MKKEIKLNTGEIIIFKGTKKEVWDLVHWFWRNFDRNWWWLNRKNK